MMILDFASLRFSSPCLVVAVKFSKIARPSSFSSFEKTSAKDPSSAVRTSIITSIELKGRIAKGFPLASEVLLLCVAWIFRFFVLFVHALLRAHTSIIESCVPTMARLATDEAQSNDGFLVLILHFT